MNIQLSPMRRDDRLTLERAGDALIINGEVFDFSGLPEGATLPRAAIASDWIAGDVSREGSILNVPLILPLGAEAPPEACFPAPIVLTSDGPVALPSGDGEPAADPDEEPAS